jgi:hypothetical protein
VWVGHVEKLADWGETRVGVVDSSWLLMMQLVPVVKGMWCVRVKDVTGASTGSAPLLEGMCVGAACLVAVPALTMALVMRHAPLGTPAKSAPILESTGGGLPVVVVAQGWFSGNDAKGCKVGDKDGLFFSLPALGLLGAGYLRRTPILQEASMRKSCDSRPCPRPASSSKKSRIIGPEPVLRLIFCSGVTPPLARSCPRSHAEAMTASSRTSWRDRPVIPRLRRPAPLTDIPRRNALGSAMSSRRTSSFWVFLRFFLWLFFSPSPDDSLGWCASEQRVDDDVRRRFASRLISTSLAGACISERVCAWSVLQMTVSVHCLPEYWCSPAQTAQLTVRRATRTPSEQFYQQRAGGMRGCGGRTRI